MGLFYRLPDYLGGYRYRSGKSNVLLLAIALVSWLRSSTAQAQTVDFQTLPQCYIQQNAVTARTVVGNSSCETYPEYAPETYAAQNLPTIPIKTVRIMFHVFQKDDGTGNWQSPTQDGGADETLLRGLIEGLPQYPAGNISHLEDVRGVNGIYSRLDQRQVYGTPSASGPAQPATGVLADSRIRFKVESVRY